MDIWLWDKEYLFEYLTFFKDIRQKDLDRVLRFPEQQYRKKRNEKGRLFYIPNNKLKKIQRALIYTVLDALPIHDAAHGFLRKRSAITHASQHIGCQVLITADVKNFFPSLSFELFKTICKTAGWDREVVAILRALCFFRDRKRNAIFVPQGTPTGPILSNVIMEPVDRELNFLARKFDFTYSRFSDDIAMSSKALIDSYELEAIVQQVALIFKKRDLILHKVFFGNLRPDIKVTNIHVEKKGLRVPDKFKDQLLYRILVLKEKEDNPSVISRRAYLRQVEGSGEGFDGR